MDYLTVKKILKSNRLGGHTGFVAILAAVIISMVLLGTSFAMSNSQFYARTGGLHQEFKKGSDMLASSCMYIALENILYDYSYFVSVNGDSFIIEPHYCTIKSINNTVEDPLTHNRVTTIITTANQSGAITTLEAKVRVHNPAFIITNPATPRIEIISWIGIP
jgi:hypothetical protein